MRLFFLGVGARAFAHDDARHSQSTMANVRGHVKIHVERDFTPGERSHNAVVAAPPVGRECASVMLRRQNRIFAETNTCMHCRASRPTAVGSERHGPASLMRNYFEMKCPLTLCTLVVTVNHTNRSNTHARTQFANYDYA